ncbi:hypothetical protein [Anaerovirgula multivorans]|nr:hypothetical protein [Anaerovirgula multivorans]
MNISEKPIFYMKSGKTFGILKGFVFHQSKLTFLYCKHQEKYVYIPIDQVVLGQDAVMLKSNYNETLLSASLKPEVYTLEGEKIGELSTIEFDASFQITAIKATDQWIKKSDIVYMDHIIIVQPLENTTNEVINIEKEIAPKISNAILQENSELAFINTDLSLAVDEPSIENSSDILETEESVMEIVEVEEVSEDEATKEEVIEKESISNHDINRDSDVDPRYSYLLGKKLLENITVAGKAFNSDTIIDSHLVQLALDNNAIVKVIMSSED